MLGKYIFSTLPARRESPILSQPGDKNLSQSSPPPPPPTHKKKKKKQGEHTALSMKPELRDLNQFTQLKELVMEGPDSFSSKLASFLA